MIPAVLRSVWHSITPKNLVPVPQILSVTCMNLPRQQPSSLNDQVIVVVLTGFAVRVKSPSHTSVSTH